MKNYRIIASDLDGTLLNSDSQVSKENIDAINKLGEMGVLFVPCTGRTLNEIPEEISNISSIRYILHSNGAVVLDRQTGNRILRCISNEMSKVVLDIVNACEPHIMFRQNGQSYVDSKLQDDASFDYYNVIEPHRDVVRNFAVYADDFKKISYEADNIEVFSVFFHNYEDKLRCKKLIEDTNCLKTVEASKYNLEIMNSDAGKGNALYSLADMLDIPYEQTISIGDSDNDSSITVAAGLGLAVSNSCDSLKEIADEIICSNDEHVVRYVLNNYIEKGKI